MRRRLLLVLLLLGGAIFLYLPIKYPLNIYDEGLALVNALRISHGEVPFRDYWAIYPPGQSYALAAVFKLAGTTILAERVYDALIRLLCALVIFLVATQMLRRWRWAAVLYIVIIGLLAAATFYGYAMFPALLFAFGALWCFFNGLTQTANKRWWLAAGIATGITALFRIDVAAYVGVALILSLFVNIFANLATARETQTQLRTFIDHSVWIIGGALLIFLPFYGYLALVGNVGELFNNLFLFPTTTFHEVRHLPYPSLFPDWSRWEQRGEWLAQVDWVLGEWVRFYLPLVIYGLSAVLILLDLGQALRKHKGIAQTNIQALAVLLLGLGLFVQAMSRYDAIHALPTALPTLLLLGWLWQRLVTARWWRLFMLPLLLLFTFIPLFVYGYLPYAQISTFVESFPPTGCFSTLPRASCVPLIAEQAAMIDYLNAQNAGSSALFVGVAQHDRIFINDVSFYFLADRPIATRYHELHPGVATTLPVQAEIAQSLEAQQTPWVVIADWGNPHEPNGSALSSGVTHLDEYIHTHYTFKQQFGNYQLWQHQGMP